MVPVHEVDLIKLDTSIELEDFDPLNHNAKPIPSPMVAMGAAVRINGNSAIPGAGAASFNNPLYPYFEPQFMLGTSPQLVDDTELLRKYGLDQLTLDRQPAGGGGGGRAATISGATATEATRSNWTTFE